MLYNGIIVLFFDCFNCFFMHIIDFYDFFAYTFSMIHYQPSTKHFSKNSAFTVMKCSTGSELHWHNAVEFIYFLSGGLEVSLNGTTFSPKANDIIVINSSVVHSFNITNSPVDYYVIIASDDFFKTNNLYSSNTFFKPFIRNEELSSIFEKIIKEYDKNDEFSNLSILSLLMSAFVFLRRNFVLEDNNPLPLESNKVNMIRDTIQYIRENYAKKITVNQIADHLHFSKGYLSHTFKSVTGYSLIEFLNLVRCQNARLLLLENYSVSQAALSSGFTEFSYFTRVFKKTMGILPSDASKEIFTIYNHSDLK